MPSSFFSTTSAFSLSWKVTIVPTFNLFAGLDKHSQILFPKSFKSSSSITAQVSSFVPISLAGITLVSFNTKTSPLCSSLLIS